MNVLSFEWPRAWTNSQAKQVVAIGSLPLLAVALTIYGLPIEIAAGTLAVTWAGLVYGLTQILKAKSKTDRLVDELIAAQELSNIGSWEFRPNTGELHWSPHLFEIFDIDPQIPVSQLFEAYKQRIHPDDQEQLFLKVDAAIRNGVAYKVEHRIIRTDGNVRYIRGAGRRASNQVLLGTAQDVTDEVLSQQQLNEAQRIAKVGSWYFDLKTGKQSWSKEHYRIFEIIEPQPQDVLHKMYRDRIHPDDLPELDRLVHRALNFGEDFVYNHRVVLDDGKRIKYVQGIGKVNRDSSGKPVYIQGTCQDRTKEVMNEAMLEQQRVILNSVLSNIPNMVFVKDQKIGSRIIYFNRAGEDLLGVKSEDLIGKSDHELFPKEQADFFTQQDKETFDRKGVMFVPQEEILTPKGLRSLRTYKIPTYQPDGSPDLLIGISTDITEELQMQQALEHERAKSIHSAKLASLGEMSAGIAHEINNPLAIISGALPLLEKHKVTPAQFAATVEKIQRASERIAKIVRGLRKFSRASDGTPHKPESLQELINDALIITETKCKRSAATIELDLDAQLPPILCDGVEIEQVLVNLINNALDAVKTASERWVRITTRREGSYAVLRVIDSGLGISPTVEGKLFQPFFTTKPVGEGTGLGLSIIKGILDQHGGSIGLDRSLQNTCFEVRLHLTAK